MLKGTKHIVKREAKLKINLFILRLIENSIDLVKIFVLYRLLVLNEFQFNVKKPKFFDFCCFHIESKYSKNLFRIKRGERERKKTFREI